MAASISAGDLERFSYCHLNWWRAKQGDPGKGGKKGRVLHDASSAAASEVQEYQRTAGDLLEISFYLALVAISGSVLALELIFLGFETPQAQILVLLSVLWLAASLYLFVYQGLYRTRAVTLGRLARVASGEVKYVDKSGERGVVLRSDVLPLSGTPDYVVRRVEGDVPVEVKSGRTPKWPYDSHVIQVAAYCYLLAEHTGRRPEYGVIAYPAKEFEVPYTKRLEDELVKAILRIQLAEATRDVHRSHQSRARCAGCSRREGCPERLDA